MRQRRPQPQRDTGRPAHQGRRHAHSRYYSEDAYERATEPKEFYVVPNAGHVDLYDKTDLIPFDKLEAFFTEHLAPGARVGEALAASVA